SFWMGFTPPAMLRRLWRAEEEAKLRLAEQGLVRARNRGEAARVILAPAAALLGGQAAAVFDPDGTGLASFGESVAVASRRRSVVVGEHSRVVVERSPYTPVFGTDEESLLRSLAGHLDMALARIAAFEASEAARLDAQQNAERLHELVYGISHDLKNPLVTVMGFTDLLAQESAGRSPEGPRFVSRIQASTSYMERLIEDLLQISRVGRFDREPAAVDLNDLVEDIGTDIESRYSGVSVACLDDVTLRINPVRARQLLTNLIENAARHGHRDRLAVRVSARCRDDGFVDLFVSDDGVGIAPEHRERVFAIFERLEGFSTDTPGTGVGLTMCRRIAEDVSGSIEIVDSAAAPNVRHFLPPPLPAEPHKVLSHAQR